ncbi:MAG: CoA-binding protein [Oligoflexia bacterium]|nr:CoA-binding protein [Oligoflexia bacterium]
MLGASDKEERYSFQALMLLKEFGHTPIPVHPNLRSIVGINCFASLGEVKDFYLNTTTPTPIDTVTVYVNPSISTNLVQSIRELRPKRVIINPGTENPLLKQGLQEAGIEVIEACTLVLLKTGQY